MVNNVTDRNNTNNSCDKLYRTHTHTHQKGKHDRNRCIISMNKYYTHTPSKRRKIQKPMDIDYVFIHMLPPLVCVII